MTFQTMLADELERRQARNPLYTLRAFARDLNVSPGRLSELLSGKKGLSSKSALKIGRLAGFTDQNIELFNLHAQSSCARSKIVREIALNKISQLKHSNTKRAPKVFTVVSYLTEAVFTLSRRKDFQTNLEWLSNELGVSGHRINGALRFLTRTGLIKTSNPKKAYIKHRAEGRRLNVDYEQILDLARKNLPNEDFDHETVLLNPEGQKKAKLIINKALQDIRNLDNPHPTSQVVMVAVQKFNL